MHVISMVCQKGGVGKTTLALHLATAFTQHDYGVVVLDLDAQASSAEWKDNRTAEFPAVQSIQPARLERVLSEARAIGADIVILDTAPHSEGSALEAANHADLVLIPSEVSIIDIRALGKTVKLLKLSQAKKVFCILNSVSPQPAEADSAAETIEAEYGLTVAPVRLGARLIYKRSLISGQTAQEVEPSGKAAKEIAKLYDWTCRTLDIPTVRRVDTSTKKGDTHGESRVRKRTVSA